MNQFQHWMQRRVSLPIKVLVLLLAGGLFVFLIPYTLLVLFPRLDTMLGFPDFYFGWINILVCVLLVIFGGYFAFSSIFQQLFKADGTPLPFIPTKKLLVKSVFHQTRNPMTLGTICMYTGVSILAGSISALLVVLLFFSLLLIYIKKIEERELEIRFGDEYIIYKAKTPFLIPRMNNKQPLER